MIEDLGAFFDEHEDEYLKFDRIQKPRSNSPDMHAFLLLTELVPLKKGEDLISHSGHDEFFLAIDPKQVVAVASEEQLIELHRCGVRYEEDSLCMFA